MEIKSGKRGVAISSSSTFNGIGSVYLVPIARASAFMVSAVGMLSEESQSKYESKASTKSDWTNFITIQNAG